jgi:ABC-type uncharacterized transport system permease subunit
VWLLSETPHLLNSAIKIVFSIVIWLYYLVLIRLRATKGWQGIPTVYGSIAGFFAFSVGFLFFRYFI